MGWGGGRDFLEEESSCASSSQDADDSPGRNGMGTLGWDLRATELSPRLEKEGRDLALWQHCRGSVARVAKAESELSRPLHDLIWAGAMRPWST